MLYMVTFTINIPQMLAYIPYMDPMGYAPFFLVISSSHFRRRRLRLWTFPSESCESFRSRIEVDGSRGNIGSP
jgi:hypothetical protein